MAPPKISLQMGVKWSNRDGKHLHFELVSSGRIVMGFSSLDNPWLVQCWEILSHKINRDISRVISYESVRASTICPYLPWVLMGFGRQRRTLFHQVQRYPADPPAFPFGNELGSECQAAKGRYHGRGHKKYGGFHKSRYPKMDRNSWRIFLFWKLICISGVFSTMFVYPNKVSWTETIGDDNNIYNIK